MRNAKIRKLGPRKKERKRLCKYYQKIKAIGTGYLIAKYSSSQQYVGLGPLILEESQIENFGKTENFYIDENI